jgi:hypothetical protein
VPAIRVDDRGAGGDIGLVAELIPNVPEHRLMRRFAEMVVSSGLLGGVLSVAK